MKKYFLTILCVLIGLNICYKSYIYFSSDKIEGRVIGYEHYTTKHRGSPETSLSPTITYQYNGITHEESKSKWGQINILDINDEVTVLISNQGENVEINTLFQFWFTLYDMMIAFSVCFIGTIILMNLIPEKEIKPTVWK
jgi:hypothetical protein